MYFVQFFHCDLIFIITWQIELCKSGFSAKCFKYIQIKVYIEFNLVISEAIIAQKLFS